MIESFSTLGKSAIILLPGILNAFNAYQNLENKCRFLITFNFKKSPKDVCLFWILFLPWLIIQIALPSIIFWLTVIKLPCQTPHSAILFIISLAYGIAFSQIAAAMGKVGTTPVDFSAIVGWFDQLIYNIFAKREERRKFWFKLENELKQKIEQRRLFSHQGINEINQGINHLKREYFRQNELYICRLDRIVDISTTNKEKQMEKIEMLVSQCMKEIIPAQDLPDILNRFKLREEFIRQYF